MKTKFVMLSTLFLLCVLLSGCSSKIQNVSIDKYLKDVAEVSIPEGVKIVGMGEATHGNKEFTELKQEVFEALVKKYGYKVFALEGDFGGCQVVNEYILNGTGTAEAAVKAIGFEIYKNEEMLNLIEWMRKYNLSVPESQKIRFYGFDMQRYDNNKNGLFSYIEKVDSEKIAVYKDSLLDLSDKSVFYQTEDKIQKGLKAIETIIKEMEQNKEKYIAKSSAMDFNLAYQYAICIKENATLRGTKVNYTQTRDRFMADKVLWILDYEKNNGNNTIFLSGHNGHVEKTSASPAGYTSMGQRLSEVFKDEYFAIGTEFYKNTFISRAARSEERKEFTLTNNKSNLINLFQKSNRNVGLLDMKTAIEDKRVSNILLSKQRMGNVGDEFSNFSKLSSYFYTIKMVPANAYNAVIFVRNVTPSTMLK